MLPLKGLPVQLYNQRWNPIYMSKPCMITMTTTFVKILSIKENLLNCSGPSCPWMSYMPYIPPIQALTCPLYSEWLYDCLDLSKNTYLRVLNGNCSDRFEEIQSTLKMSTHFEEPSEVSTTYKGKLCPTGRYFEFENQIFV